MSAQAKFTSLQAAADFLGNGAIEVNQYEPEIADAVRRNSIARQRFKDVPSTGQPHRYVEETAIGTAAFTDPRNISPTPTGPTRVERTAFIKGLTAQTNFSLFDTEVTAQQKQFSNLVARDIDDIANAVLVTSGVAIWTGTDTSLTAPTTIQYMGLLNQITQVATIAAGASIIDGVKAAVAQMMANQGYVVRPTAIYANPVALDYLDREAKGQNITMGSSVVGGVSVKGLQTQAGELPLIPDPFLPASAVAAYGFPAPPSGMKNYFFVIVNEAWIERPVVSGAEYNPDPRIFKLGLLSGLAGQYVAVMFDAILAKGSNYMHYIVCLQRP